MKRGFVKLQRRLIYDTPIIKDGKALQVYIYCLIRASHEDRTIAIRTPQGGMTLVKLRKGQCIVGRRQMADDLNLSPSTIRNKLHLLTCLKILDREPNRHYTKITVMDFDICMAEGESVGPRPGPEPDQSRTQRRIKELKKEEHTYSVANTPEKINGEDQEETPFQQQVRTALENRSSLISLGEILKPANKEKP